MLVTFPFGLFVSATVFDLTDVLGGPAFLGEVGYWTSVAALFAAALAAVAGMIDLWDVPVDRTQRTAITFNLVNVAMAALFLITCLVRADAPQRGASVALLITELVALGVGAVGVLLGARLVRRFEAVSRAEANSFDALPDFPDATADLSPHRL